MRRTHRWNWGTAMRKTKTAVIGIFLLALAACGSGGGTGSSSSSKTPSEASSTTAPTSTQTAPSTGVAGMAAVQVASTSLGDVLVDAKGTTLYLYDPDNQGAPTCYQGCATAWPPLVVTGKPTVGTGADDSKLGTVARTDGSMQVTYNKWPLYYFVKDSAKGDTKGQGVGGIWWALGADGKAMH